MKIGLLGCGNVGAALIKLLSDNQPEIERRTGERLEVVAIAVKDLAAPRPDWVRTELLTDDAFSVVNNEEIEIIVEVIGGIHPAKELIEAALVLKKSVITANKALLSQYYFELEEFAEEAGRDIFFEAAVAGGIPLIRSLRVSLAGENLSRLTGIVNGTTNFILTRMDEAGLAFDDALELAKELGYAEADPKADLEGADAAAKAAILASVAFGYKVRFSDVTCEGIMDVSADDIEFAKRHDYVVKLLAQCERANNEGEEEITVRVFPALMPRTHPLAAVRDAFNAIFVEGAAVGELMFYGRGAGGFPTASAILGDLMDAAHNLRGGSTERRLETREVGITPIERIMSRYYISIDVFDRPGVLAQVADVFGRNSISIRSMEQVGLDDDARLVFLTHLAQEDKVSATLEELSGLLCVKEMRHAMRVIGDEE